MSGERVQLFLSKYWLPAFVLLFGAYGALPFLAPVFMQLGWTGPGEAVYTIYSFLCHQLPQRSFFLFGPQASYSLGELQAAGVDTSDLLVLRRFAALTNQAFSPGFYTGDALGSFNSWMRLVTGILFGLGIVWFGFPMLDEAFQAPVRHPSPE